MFSHSYSCTNIEPAVPGDASSSDPRVIPAYNGTSASFTSVQ
jgi:hypothetical protein